MSLTCRPIQAILEDPIRSWRFGFMFGISGIALVLAGMLGPKALYVCRFVAIIPLLFSYICFRAYCMNRHRQRPNQLGAQDNAAIDTQSNQAGAPPSQLPYPISTGNTGETTYINSNGLTYTPGSVEDDPSLPPPYHTVTLPPGGTVPDLPPPPSYEEATRHPR